MTEWPSSEKIEKILPGYKTAKNDTEDSYTLRHIKPGLIKNCVKTMNRNGEGSWCLEQMIPQVKEWICVRPLIKQILMKS